MHLSTDSSPQPDQSRWYWRVVFSGVIIGIFFGTWGYLIYAGDNAVENASFFTALYHAVQLFALHMPLLEGHINWQLEIGRWAAAIASGLAVLLVLSRAFLTEWRLFHIRWAKNHVVVCGLGEVGTRLALEFRRAGSNVVAIERGVTAPGVSEVESQGIPVIIGDAKDHETLRRVRAHHAMNLLAVCSDDDTNIAITVAVRDLAAAETSAPPNAECRLLLADRDLHERVAPYLTSTGGAGEFRIKVGGFDMPETVARLAFDEHPLDFDGIREQDSISVHLVLVGTCPLGEALAVKALQLCHFANRSRPRVTVVGNDAHAFISRLRQRHPYAEPWYEAQAVECDRSDTALPEKIAALPVRDELVTVAICPGSGHDGDIESQNVLMATAIENALQSGNPAKQTQILVYLRRRSGFGSLFGSMGKSGGGVSIHAFGLIETLYNLDTLLHEKQDAVARALHLEYFEEQEERKKKAEAVGQTFEPRPAHKPWEILSESFRESNRIAADHLAVKLRAVGLYMDTPKKPGALDSFMDTGDTLAMMEHERWCAEHWLDGWRLGTRNDQAKVHPDLKPWDELPLEERYIDQNFAAKTVRVTERAGRAIYPSSAKNG
jgi:hypothetical protein